MIIDSHQHLILPTELQIEKLNKAQVDKAILFCTTPHPERANTLEELKNEMKTLYKVLANSNKTEDWLKTLKNNIKTLTDVLQKYPDKFWGFGSVPLGLSLNDTIDWIENYIVSNSLKGIGEFTPGSDEEMSQLEVIFQALDNYSYLPIWVHTFNPVSLNALKLLMKFTKKYPNIPVIFGHMGGYNWMELIEFVKTAPNAYIDLSATFSTLAAHMAITELPEKCLYSSDAPYGEPLLSKQLIEYISPSKEITNKVLGENILRLIGEI